METHDQHHQEEEERHPVIGLVPAIIFLIAVAIAVVFYSMHGSGPRAF